MDPSPEQEIEWAMLGWPLLWCKKCQRFRHFFKNEKADWLTVCACCNVIRYLADVEMEDWIRRDILSRA